jgi:hypothetical protein
MILLRLFGVYAAVVVEKKSDPARLLAFVCFTRRSTFTTFETFLGLQLLRDFVW